MPNPRPANPAKTYHHGDLRRAIIDAGEAELAERGVHGFSLRRVAARVGVSHTAPSHHFGDASGLIDALAERGFRRLLDCMQARQDTVAGPAHERLIASGLGYLDFAKAHPALFRLVFTRPAGAQPDPAVMSAAEAAFMHLAEAVAALHGAAPLAHPDARVEVLACWTRAHGFAELMLAGHIDIGGAAPPPDGTDICGPGDPADLETLFRSVFAAEFSPRG